MQVVERARKNRGRKINGKQRQNQRAKRGKQRKAREQRRAAVAQIRD
jgi:hypothetical protein